MPKYSLGLGSYHVQYGDNQLETTGKELTGDFIVSYKQLGHPEHVSHPLAARLKWLMVVVRK